MKGFDLQIRLHALNERREGRTWKEIKQSIQEKFSVAPPTVRAMQKWEKEIDRESLNRALMEQAKKQMPHVKESALSQIAGGLIPILWQARDAGEDIELAGWKWFFSIIESQLGSEKFKQVVSQYLNDMARRKLPPTNEV